MIGAEVVRQVLPVLHLDLGTQVAPVVDLGALLHLVTNLLRWRPASRAS